MQLDVDIEPTFGFSYMETIDKQKDITMKQLSHTFVLMLRHLEKTYGVISSNLLAQTDGK